MALQGNHFSPSYVQNEISRDPQELQSREFDWHTFQFENDSWAGEMQENPSFSFRNSWAMMDVEFPAEYRGTNLSLPEMKLVHPQDLLIEFTFSSRTWEGIFRDILVGIPNCHITNGFNDFPAVRWLNKLVFRELAKGQWGRKN
ncbi:hypothetical protein CEXT_40781 [Caerostris extrusa]|uniref:Uncharacterized protein n=1 Tax=Caerostris extrusa TaxID=172846 RepID=A0AAV4Y392_CAEEX|nr:hypothetical protein CEXT_40781 [Caerostris extrusa]